MNIVTAIRNLPEPPAPKPRRRRWLPGAPACCSARLLAYAGASGQERDHARLRRLAR